ncbi:MAG: hypothetical protein ACPL7B_06220, partial [Candidatus Poribacteria bacterium]
MKSLMILGTLIVLSSFQYAYCANVDLYIFSTDDNENILIKIHSFAGENIQIVLKEETIKDSNIKIYKPAMENELWDYWKFEIFLDLAKISEEKNNIKKSAVYDDYITFYRFVNLIKDKIGSEYSSTIQFAEKQINITAYNINNMLKAEPNSDIIRRLCIFGYGIDNADAVFLIKKAKEGNVSVVLPPPFKEMFTNSVRQFVKNVKKPIQIPPYLIIALILSLIIICSIIFVINIYKKSRNLERENIKLSRNLSNIKRQNEPIVEKEKNMTDHSQADSYYLDLFFNVISDVHKSLTDQIIITKAGESIIKIGSILESISLKIKGNWLDMAKKRLCEIVQDAFKTESSDLNIPKPKNIDEFQKIDWSKEFIPLINKLVTYAKSSNEQNQKSKQILAEIGQDVIVPIVSAIDREKSKNNVDLSVENNLKELLAIAR